MARDEAETTFKDPTKLKEKHRLKKKKKKKKKKYKMDSQHHLEYIHNNNASQHEQHRALNNKQQYLHLTT